MSGHASLSIGILLGDDIGLEVVPECVKVMQAAAAQEQLDIAWRPLPIGKRGRLEGLILRRAHACMRPSRRMAAGTISLVAVLRDAPPKAALLRTRLRDARTALDVPISGKPEIGARSSGRGAPI